MQPGTHVEHNTNNFTGSTLNNSPIAVGSNATAFSSQTGRPEEQQVQAAIGELQTALRQALATTDRRDDETRESLQLAEGRLSRLQEELQGIESPPDPERVNKLLAGIRDAVAGVTGLLVSVDGLWGAVEKMVS